jgi:predicted P-loop ATPase
MYIKFNTIEDFNTWHNQIKNDLSLGEKNYTKPLLHPQNNTIICGYNRLVNTTNLEVITRTEAILQGYIEGDVSEAAKIVISEAMEFGRTLVVDFAAENVLMGITQAGKTKAVADYLSDVSRYTQTGSLYEVISEIDRLIQEGLPSDLEPFITESRLIAFKQKIIDYLT